MTGPEHYRKAEQILARVGDVLGRTDVSSEAKVKAYEATTARALVHATLALAAATIAGNNAAWAEVLR